MKRRDARAYVDLHPGMGFDAVDEILGHRRGEGSPHDDAAAPAAALAARRADRNVLVDEDGIWVATGKDEGTTIDHVAPAGEWFHSVTDPRRLEPAAHVGDRLWVRAVDPASGDTEVAMLAL